MRYENDIPVIEKGISLDRLCFSGGRVAVDIARHGGISEIKYFGNQRMNEGVLLFKADLISAWQQLFRTFVKINGSLYYAEFNDTKIFPYGYESFCSIDSVLVKHSLVLLNEAIVFEFEVISAPKDCEVEFLTSISECCVKAGFSARNWKSFEFDDESNSMTASVIDDYRGELQKESSSDEYLTQTSALKNEYIKSDYIETHVAVTSSMPINVKKYREPFEKSIVSVEPVDGYGNIILVFGKDKKSFTDLLCSLQNKAKKDCIRQRERFDNIYKTQTKVTCTDKTVQSYMNNARGIIESLTVEDIPGGMRAADSGYWIWGWDSMVHSDAAMLSNNHEWVLQMLKFHMDRSHPELGIFHSMDLSGQPTMSMAYPAQTLYCLMLYNYYIYTLDREVAEEYYDFAKKILEKAIAAEVKDTGLMEGVSLYPDFPEFLGQTGNDISTFNNSICYQAIRCMEILASELNRNEDVDKYCGYGSKMKDSFNRYLFDEDKGYYFDSVSSIDFIPRCHYPVYAILWLTPFAEELVYGREKRIAEFMHKNLKTRIGTRILPKWDSGFMVDGNQLAMYMPVTEGFFRYMMKVGGYEDGLLDLIELFWSQITLPEALTAEMENHGLTPDNPGRKQGFCINSWYVLFFSYYLGVSMSVDGLTFNKPICGNNKVQLEGLKWGEKIIDVIIDLVSKENIKIRINGVSLESEYIAYSDLQEHNVIELV